MAQKQHTGLTEEDVAFAAAQWGSGISQREIAAIFGYATSSQICSSIAHFVWKYTDVPPGLPQFQGNGRRQLMKLAVAGFVAERVRREMSSTEDMT